MSTATSTRPSLRPVPRVVPPERRPPARAHLTRRGRLAILLVIAALLFTAFSLGRAGGSASGDSAGPSTPRLQQVTVMPGDTLWSVAERIAPDNDPREVVAQIRELNDLSGTQLEVGQQLLLPIAAA